MRIHAALRDGLEMVKTFLDMSKVTRKELTKVRWSAMELSAVVLSVRHLLHQRQADLYAANAQANLKQRRWVKET